MLKIICLRKCICMVFFLVPEAYFLCSIDYSDSSLRVFSSLSNCKFHKFFYISLLQIIFWMFSVIKCINIGYWLYFFEMVILQSKHQHMSKVTDVVRKSSQEIITTKMLFCFIGYTWKFISCSNQEVLN